MKWSTPREYRLLQIMRERKVEAVLMWRGRGVGGGMRECSYLCQALRLRDTLHLQLAAPP